MGANYFIAMRNEARKIVRLTKLILYTSCLIYVLPDTQGADTSDYNVYL